MHALLLLLVLLLAPAHAALREYAWTVSLAPVSADGGQSPPPLHPVVNGQQPGTLLRARVNDTVVLRVYNALPSAVTSLHWHGVKQVGTPHADGLPGVSQCGIAPGQTFEYRFRVDRPGTLWWHSHSAMQKMTMSGAIVVHGDERVVGDYPERVLVLGEWWHRDQREMSEGLKKPVPDFEWVGDADSLLINGRAVFDCDVRKGECGDDAKRLSVLHVDPGVTYRVRVIGAQALALLNLHFDAHVMRVVEVESTLVRPFNTDALDVTSGQSYSVLLRTKTRKELRTLKNNNGLFWIRTTVRHRGSDKEGLAILRYSTADANATLPMRTPRRAPERDDIEWSLRHVRRFKSRFPVDLPPATRQLSILGTQNQQADGTLLWAVNNISFIKRPTPLLHTMQFRLREETKQWIEQSRIPNEFDFNQTLGDLNLSTATKTGTHVIKLRKDEVVDIVFQNTRALNGAEEVHPWHIHMHNFWVLAYGDYQTTWKPRDRASYDLRYPVSRNTFTLYPGGWTVVRLKADNPGIIFFHCHIVAHLEMGMGFMLQVGEAEDVPPPPRGTQYCGAVNELLTPDLSLLR